MALNLPPTGADIRSRVPVAFLQSLGYPATDGSESDPMDSFAETAVAYVASTTGREITNAAMVSAAPSGFFVDFMASGGGSSASGLDLQGIAWRAVVLRAIQEATHESTSYMQATVSQDYLKSFKAGSYAEERRDPETVLRSRGSVSNPPINEWRELSDLLWLLLTDEMWEYWQLRLGNPMPAAIFAEQDFRDSWDAPGGLRGMPGFGSPGLGGAWGDPSPFGGRGEY